MKPLITIFLALLFFTSVVRAQGLLPADQFQVLTHEHLDGPCVLYNPADSPPLSIVAWQRDAGLDLPTNQFICVVKEQARLTLPAGTPFGDAGAPFWILPQSQNPSLLYMGVNVERVPSGVFAGPIAIQLKRLDGPGYFMVWQATGPGQYNIRINTRDDIGSSDFLQPLIGAHEHFNWGFSTTGVYCATFQAVGQRLGESTNITSAECTFLFHVLPLPPATNFLTWQKHFWPPGFNPPTSEPDADPDADGAANAFEYASGTSPTNALSVSHAPDFSFVEADGGRFGAAAFTRYAPARDLEFVVEATSTLSSDWQPLTQLFHSETIKDSIERITIRDEFPATNDLHRFYRLKATLR